MGDRDVAEIDFHFDLMCPFAYQTSLWLREVRRQRDLTVNWRFFSLEEINRAEGKKHAWERARSYGWSMMQIGAALRREGMHRLDDWYLLAGRALHEQGRQPQRVEVARELLAEMGADPDLAEAAVSDPSTGAEIRAEHQRVVDLGGFGVPTVVFPDGQALFGPVLVDPPVGAAALRLWELVVGWREFPHLYELQRPKTAAEDTVIARTLTPYLRGRDWVSINRGEVVEFPSTGATA